jgi:hypothetical protein
MTSHDADPMVIVGCSRRKAAATEPVPALDLYQGGCIPALRGCTDRHPGLRGRVWIISAEHGLLHADTLLLPYDRRMDPGRALILRAQVSQCLRSECLRNGTPREALVIAEPFYQLALADLPLIIGHDRVGWISDPQAGWLEAAAIIKHWSEPWPST